jgi:hypothetical protein
MKYLFFILLLSTTALASEKECKQECKVTFKECQSKVHFWAEDQYIEIEGLSYFSTNSYIDDRYDEVRAQEKEMKKICKEDQKYCVKACHN